MERYLPECPGLKPLSELELPECPGLVEAELPECPGLERQLLRHYIILSESPPSEQHYTRAAEYWPQLVSEILKMSGEWNLSESEEEVRLRTEACLAEWTNQQYPTIDDVLVNMTI